METNPALVTIEDMRRVRPIVQNIQRFEKFEQFVKQAQMLDIRPILGPRLFAELLDLRDDERFQDLLNGEAYQDASSIDVIFVGLKDIICLFAFSRFIIQHGVTVTESGAVQKQGQDSQPVDWKMLDKQSREAKTEAIAYVEDLRQYLFYKRDDFPLYNSTTMGIDYRKSSLTSFKIRVAGKRN